MIFPWIKKRKRLGFLGIFSVAVLLLYTAYKSGLGTNAIQGKTLAVSSAIKSCQVCRIYVFSSIVSKLSNRGGTLLSSASIHANQ